MRRTSTRFFELRRLFRHGQSEMYDRIAQICVIYEDLRIETTPLFTAAQRYKSNKEVKNTFKLLYCFRRSVASLMEFKGALNQLNSDDEFKRGLPTLSEIHKQALIDANNYLKANEELIKALRNGFGGHFAFKYAQHATRNFPPDDIGKLEWIFDDKVIHWSLNADLAAHIVVAGLGHSLKSQTDLLVEFRETIQAITLAYKHAQEATYALVHGFLWEK